MNINCDCSLRSELETITPSCNNITLPLNQKSVNPRSNRRLKHLTSMPILILQTELIFID